MLLYLNTGFTDQSNIITNRFLSVMFRRGSPTASGDLVVKQIGGIHAGSKKIREGFKRRAWAGGFFLVFVCSRR